MNRLFLVCLFMFYTITFAFDYALCADSRNKGYTNSTTKYRSYKSDVQKSESCKVSTKTKITTNTNSIPKSPQTKTIATKSATFTTVSNKKINSRSVAEPNRSMNQHISSKSYLVYDELRQKSYVSKDADVKMPIASLTKIMSAMVLLDAGLSMDEKIEITHDDVDTIRNSSSRLEVGSVLTRKELLQMALMSSENRATFALARTYPGGRRAFVQAMNEKARELGMKDTIFVEPTGLSENNISTAQDLLKMVHEANRYILIKQYSTIPQKDFFVNGKVLTYRNSNYLVREGDWDINLSKTGYIKESGKCLIMHTIVGKNPVIFILLGSESAQTRIHDASKLRDIYIAKNGGRV